MAALIVAVGLALPVHIAAWQSGSPTIESAHLTADLTAGNGGAAVRIEYRFSNAPAEFDIPIQLLGFGPTTAEQVRVDGRETVVLWPASGALRAATVRRSESVDGSSGRIVLEYDVLEAVEQVAGAFVVRLPVAVVRLPGREGAEDLFRAAIALPSAWKVADGFPSGIRLGEDGAYSASLSVVPSVLRLQGRTDGVWRPGFPLVVDLIIVTLLLAFAYRGWRHLRRLAE